MHQNVNFEFNTIYWPGEDAPPQFHLEEKVTLDLPWVPRYSDRVRWREDEWFVYKVSHDLEGSEINIVATRRVTHPPKETD